MAESLATEVFHKRPPRDVGRARVIQMAWQSDGDGNVLLETDEKYTGQIEQVTTDPVNTPSNNYDIELSGSLGGVDLMQNSLRNRDDEISEIETYSGSSSGKPGWLFNESIILTITNAGADKQGIIYILMNPFVDIDDGS